MRHNRKTDVLRFKFDSGFSDISFVTLHLYLRGLEWISVYQPKILEELADCQNTEIVVALHRAIRRANNTNYTHKAKIFEFRHKIPSGLGQWVNVDLKPLLGTGTAINPSQTQEIFIKGVEPWMRPLVVTTDSTAKNPLVYIKTSITFNKQIYASEILFSVDSEIESADSPFRHNFQ